MAVIDNRTPNLNLPLPNQDNQLVDDVARLRSAFGTLDTEVAGKQAALGFTPENAANKGAANGYAGLDSGGKVPAAQLPSYVDDVLEYANTGAFPGTGEAGKIYVALDTGKTYRWGGSAYVEISASPGTTDSLVEGSTNLYFTAARALAAIPIASTETAGRVKPGAGLSVAGDGTLNLSGTQQTFDDLTLIVSANGQTSFTVSGGYVPGAVDVHLNGVKLNGGGDDYTANNGTSVTLTVGANTTDLLVLRRWGTFEVANAVTPSGAQTLTNKTLTGYTETVFALTGTTPAISVSNGTVQTWTLSANSAPTDGLATGQSVTLMIDDGSAFTITWPSVTWKTDGGVAPTLNTSGFTAVVLWKVGSVLYGARVGDQ